MLLLCYLPNYTFIYLHDVPMFNVFEHVLSITLNNFVSSYRLHNLLESPKYPRLPTRCRVHQRNHSRHRSPVPSWQWRSGDRWYFTCSFDRIGDDSQHRNGHTCQAVCLSNTIIISSTLMRTIWEWDSA